MDQNKLLSILLETKEDLYKSLREALHRRFINDARRFRESIAIVSRYIQRIEAQTLDPHAVEKIMTEIEKHLIIENIRSICRK